MFYLNSVCFVFKFCMLCIQILYVLYLNLVCVHFSKNFRLKMSWSSHEEINLVPVWEKMETKQISNHDGICYLTFEWIYMNRFQWDFFFVIATEPHQKYSPGWVKKWNTVENVVSNWGNTRRVRTSTMTSSRVFCYRSSLKKWKHQLRCYLVGKTHSTYHELW